MLAIEIVRPGHEVETAFGRGDFFGDFGVVPPQSLEEAAPQRLPVHAGLGFRQQPRHVENQWRGHTAR